MAGKKVKSTKLKVQSSQKKPQFPQIFRRIPATSTVAAAFNAGASRLKLPSVHAWRWLVIVLISATILLQIVLFWRDLYLRYEGAQAKQAEKAAIEEEIAVWEQVVEDKPDYRDAYFRLAVLTYQLNLLDETEYYLEKVFALDPNYEPARGLEKTLGARN